MEIPDENLRPAEMLDRFLAHTGHNRDRFTLTSQSSVYGRFMFWENGEWSTRWVSLGVADGVGEALTEAYNSTVAGLGEDWHAGKTETCRQIISLAVIAFGEGRVMRNPEAPPVTEELLSDPKARVLHELSQTDDWYATRSIVLVTPEGIASSATLNTGGDREPITERSEMWVSDQGVNRDGAGNEGQLPELLTSCFGLLMLITQGVSEGRGVNMATLLETLNRHTDNPDTHEGAVELRDMVQGFVNETVKEARDTLRRLGDLTTDDE